MFSLPKKNKLYCYKYHVNNSPRDLTKEEEEGRFRMELFSSFVLHSVICLCTIKGLILSDTFD